jgi:dihydropyrimidinase
MGKAEGRAVIDYGFHMIICDLTDEVESEMDALIRQGVTSFKMFMAYPDRLMLDDGSIFRAMLRTKENGGLVTLHAENGHVIELLVARSLAEGRTEPKYHALTRPARAEAEAVYRGVALAEMADVPVYVVHLSSADGLRVVTEARERGRPVYAETCPQYLFLSHECYEEPGFEGAKYVMSPPLRTRGDQEALWNGLVKNDVQAVATDHCPFSMSGQKSVGLNDFTKIPGGVPGIETRMSLAFHGGVGAGRMSINRFVEITATQPAKLFGMWPARGTIAPGSIADIVVFDPERQITLDVENLHMRVDYSPYQGMSVRGAPAIVFSRGEIIVEDGKFCGQPGRGRYIKRSTR